MPLFEYRCRQCGSICELLVRGGERPVCPHCESDGLDKLMSAAAVQASGTQLPIAGACPPSDAPPCNPFCCRLPQG